MTGLTEDRNSRVLRERKHSASNHGISQCRISRSICTCDNEQSTVFVGARYKHVRIHEEYDLTYLPPGPPRWSKRRVLVVRSNFRHAAAFITTIKEGEHVGPLQQRLQSPTSFQRSGIHSCEETPYPIIENLCGSGSSQTLTNEAVILDPLIKVRHRTKNAARLQ